MLKEYFEKHKENIFQELGKSKFKYTSRLLLNNYRKSESIDSVIINTDAEINYYPCIILLRSQIEHYLTSTYIWIQFRINDNDAVSETYYREYLFFEILKRHRYAKSNNIPSSDRFSNAFQKILDILTDKKILKQQDIDGLNKCANQFDIKRISKFFDQNLPLENDNIIIPETIKGFLAYYNYFSSFVHGGPSADATIAENANNAFVIEAKKLITKSSILVGFHRLYILYFLSMSNDKLKIEFQEAMNKLEKPVI